VLTLVIGNKNLSSWSLRPWLLLKHLNLEFREVQLSLDTPLFQAEIAKYSPTRRVPVLLDGDVTVWDSLAICEYANEKTQGRAWPGDVRARAHARAVAAEMHSGFQALRQAWPMRAAERLKADLPDAGVADVARIDALWQDCRARYAAGGPWLFGAYSAADAMYAPVVLRFATYGANVSSSARAYIEQTLADGVLREWLTGAERELAAASS
jgi:glutathione S-transferase